MARRSRGWWPASPEAQTRAVREEKLEATFRIGFPATTARTPLDEDYPLVLQWDPSRSSAPPTKAKEIEAKWRGTFFCTTAGMSDKSASSDTLIALRGGGRGQQFLELAVQVERQLLRDVLVNMLIEWKEQLLVAIASDLSADGKDCLLCLGENWDTHCVTAWLRAHVQDVREDSSQAFGVRKIPSLRQLATRFAAPVLLQTGSIRCKAPATASDSEVQLQNLPTYFQHIIEGGTACRICGLVDYYQEGCDLLSHNADVSIDLIYTALQEGRTVPVDEGGQCHSMDDNLHRTISIQQLLEVIDLNVEDIQAGRHVPLDAWEPVSPSSSSSSSFCHSRSRPRNNGGHYIHNGGRGGRGEEWGRGRGRGGGRGGGGGGRHTGWSPDKYNSGSRGRREDNRSNEREKHGETSRGGSHDRHRQQRYGGHSDDMTRAPKRKHEGDSHKENRATKDDGVGEIDKFGRIRKRNRGDAKG